MEIDRRKLIGGIAGIATTAALGVPALEAEEMDGFGFSFDGPIASEAAFGEGEAGFEALKDHLRAGDWIIINETRRDDMIRSFSWGLAFEIVGPDGKRRITPPDADDIAVRAFHLLESHPMPSPDELWRMTHATRFAVLHAFRICGAHGIKKILDKIRYPATGGFEDGYIDDSPWHLTVHGKIWHVENSV